MLGFGGGGEADIGIGYGGGGDWWVVVLHRGGGGSEFCFCEG